MTETFIISPFTLTVHQSLLEVAVISLIALTFIVPVPPADSNVTFASCTYSLQELKELHAKLKVSFAKKAALRDEIGWVAVGIRPIQNRIVVYLNNASNKNISKFKNEICNSDKIIFDQLEMEPIEIQKDTAKDEKVGSPS